VKQLTPTLPLTLSLPTIIDLLATVTDCRQRQTDIALITVNNKQTFVLGQFGAIVVLLIHLAYVKLHYKNCF